MRVRYPSSHEDVGHFESGKTLGGFIMSRFLTIVSCMVKGLMGVSLLAK